MERRETPRGPRAWPSTDRHRGVHALGAIAPILICLALAPAAHAAFGFHGVEENFTDPGGSAMLPAGSHPETWSTDLTFKTTGPPGEEVPDGALKDLHISLPAGLVGAPALLPECPRVDFISETCPVETAVGTVDLAVSIGALPPSTLYLLEPQPGTAAELGLHARGVPVTIDLSISPSPPYNLVASLTEVSQAAGLFGSTLTLEGTPNGNAFLTLPRSCTAPLQTIFAADSWQSPAMTVLGGAAEPQPAIGCGDLSYSPSLEVAPTSTAAASPSGLDLTLNAPDPGIASPSGRAAADTSSATLVLPPGLTINPPLAIGLTACTPAQLAAETPSSAPGQGCPEASKLGTAEVTTPLFSKPIAGSLFVAEPDDPATPAPGAENPFDSLLAFYLVLRDPERGVLLSLPVRIDADPQTGRLTASFEQIPQLPLDRLELHLNAGPRAALTTPAACGAHRIAYVLTPSSGSAPLLGSDSFTTGAADCNPGFAPNLSAGTSSNAAGRSAPFVFDLARQSGEADLSQFSLTLPTGLSADFAAVPLCSESQATTGDCPAESKVGFARVALGNGTEPLWVPPGAEPGSAVYLAGPYRGAPFSLVVVVPARAGPYDLGTVITRAALRIDRRTAAASVEAGPLPQIIAGVPLHYRDLRIVLDRPGFIRNPTSCAPAAVSASIASVTGTIAAATDRFQAGDCARLGFKPGAAVRLLGPTHRGAHPRLRAVLAPRAGDSNIGGATVTLPSTVLLDSRRIRAICSAPQFSAGRCPAGSLYGHAKAWTPILSRPLEGPVYLRESKTRLPDLVVSLAGQVDLDLVAHVSTAGGRLRTTLAGLPDAPFSKVVLTLSGGRRGLLVNSGGLCSGARRAGVDFAGQNGKAHQVNPAVVAPCGKSGSARLFEDINVPMSPPR